MDRSLSRFILRESPIMTLWTGRERGTLTVSGGLDKKLAAPVGGIQGNLKTTILLPVGPPMYNELQPSILEWKTAESILTQP